MAIPTTSIRSWLNGNESLPIRRGNRKGRATSIIAQPTVHSSLSRIKTFERTSPVDMKYAQARDSTNQFMPVY